MKSRKYEWDVETIDEDGNVVDHNFFDSLIEAPLPLEEDEKLVLVLTTYSPSYSQHWAYVKDGKLPESFKDADEDDTYKVPKLFHNELNRFITKH